MEGHGWIFFWPWPGRTYMREQLESGGLSGVERGRVVKQSRQLVNERVETQKKRGAVTAGRDGMVLYGNQGPSCKVDQSKRVRVEENMWGRAGGGDKSEADGTGQTRGTTSAHVRRMDWPLQGLATASTSIAARHAASMPIPCLHRDNSGGYRAKHAVGLQPCQGFDRTWSSRSPSRVPGRHVPAAGGNTSVAIRQVGQHSMAGTGWCSWRGLHLPSHLACHCSQPWTGSPTDTPQTWRPALHPAIGTPERSERSEADHGMQGQACKAKEKAAGQPATHRARPVDGAGS